mgnify:CR=1 FL=1|uniref:Uncharacterized protein n=1 Tax=Siphoviridae sp. ctqED62 TaxID=2826468 RepID=A0A8S5MRI0_9CAUD|nr:MAG TPA: Protein of unknown function (DUF1670) [Siphoviridae sp. ctqED62]
MDATFLAVSRLWEQGESRKTISRSLNLSEGKVRKILVTLGAYESDITRMFRSGMAPDIIAQRTGKSLQAINTHIPYDKGMYGAQYPTKNALKIRKTREKQKGENKND